MVSRQKRAPPPMNQKQRTEKTSHSVWCVSASNHFFNYRFRWKFAPTPYRNVAAFATAAVACAFANVRVFVFAYSIELCCVDWDWYSSRKDERQFTRLNKVSECCMYVWVCVQIKKVAVIQSWSTLKEQRQCCVYSTSYRRWYSVAIVKCFDEKIPFSVLLSRCWIEE